MRRTLLALGLGGTLLLVLLASALGEGPNLPRDGSRASDGEAQGPGATRRPPRPHALLIVLDELPSDSLLGPSGRIDAGRYPNLAALARDSTWFRNAYSSYDSTTKAVPLILDGMRPSPGTSPDRRGHPRSIFTALGRSGYRIVASEEATALCPPRLCRGGRSRRPAIVPLLNGGRPERFLAFLRGIRASRRPTFWMKHVLLPHGPYLYLPSGARTRPRSRDLLPGMNTTPGFHDEYLTRHNEQRYLLQLGFVDRLIGRLVGRLESQGIYDDTLVVVTADHGFAWQVGVSTRRSVNGSNVEELTPVPLLVKRPGQRTGRVSPALAQTLDVTPTIADVLGVSLGYRPQGRSAFSSAVRRRRSVALTTRDFSRVVRISARAWRARRAAVVRRRLRQLGSRDWGGLYTGIGPRRALIGRELSAFERPRSARARASLALRGSFANVRRASGVVPTQVAGTLEAAGAGRAVAVAVNGRIEATGRTFRLAGDPAEHFAVNVPEAALREGTNEVQVFEITSRGSLRLLARS